MWPWQMMVIVEWLIFEWISLERVKIGRIQIDRWHNIVMLCRSYWLELNRRIDLVWSFQGWEVNRRNCDCFVLVSRMQTLVALLCVLSKFLWASQPELKLLWLGENETRWLQHFFCLVDGVVCWGRHFCILSICITIIAHVWPSLIWRGAGKCLGTALTRLRTLHSLLVSKFEKWLFCIFRGRKLRRHLWLL